MEITGQIVFIDPTRIPQESKPDFKTRAFAVETSQEVNFDTVIKHWGFQTIKPEVLDGVGVGDTVKISFNIRCNLSKRDSAKFSPTAQNPNNQGCFASLDAVKIEVVERVKQHSNTTTAEATSQGNPIPQPSGDAPKNAEGEVMVWNTVTGVWEAPLF